MLSVSIRIRMALICCLSVGILQSGAAFGVDSRYIEAVKADVAEFSTREFHPPAHSDWMGSMDSDSIHMMDLNDFSDYLKEASPGSFIFFKKLPDEYQKRVLEEYLQTGDLDRVKEDVFKFTREAKNK